MAKSVVPNAKAEHTTYLVLQYGKVWHELGEGEANETMIAQSINQGQFSRPVRVVAFNTEDGWSRDVTQEIAVKLLDLNQNGVALGAAAREFVERVTGQSATVAV
jgi:hypothetical protein